MNGFKVPIYINARDRLEDLAKLVDWLEKAGYENLVFLDNASTYPPLLEYFEKTPHRVERLVPPKEWQESRERSNYGSKSLWRAEMIPSEWFVFTDPDLLPIEKCPKDIVDYLYRMLRLHPWPKAGAGLYLKDVPRSVQSLAWGHKLVHPGREVRKGVFDSQVDTTFALYRPNSQFSLRALRLGFPYQMRHLPWYHLGEPSEEESYYLAHAERGPEGSSWAEGTQ